MDKASNALNWFEIPTVDFERARKFYSDIFAVEMGETWDMGGLKMSSFPYEMGSSKVSGAVVHGPQHKPSKEGVIVYLNANPEIQKVIDRIEKAGGKVVMPKTQVTPEIGYMCMFIDSEGNMMALHANN